MSPVLGRRAALGLGLAGGAALLAGCSGPTIVDTGIAPDVPTRVSTIWSNRADGPMPGAGDDGTPFTVVLSGPTERPAVRGGALVGNLPAAPGATYVGQRLPAPVSRIGARFGFGPGDVGGAIALVAFTGENPPRANLHVVFTPDRWIFGVVADGGVQEITRKPYTDPLPQDGTPAQGDVRRSGQTVWVNAPDGTVHRVDDPRFAAPAGVIATWEFFKYTADSADVRMAATWAGVIAPVRARSWVPGALFGLVGGGLGIVQLLVVTLTPGVWRPLAFSSDDLHYYVLPALNLAQGAGSTFDGLQPTNGYQPLWFLVLAAAFRVVGVDRAGAFVVVMALLVVLWGLAVRLLWRLRPFLTTTGAAAGLAVLLLHGRWWSGCENALVGVLLLVLVDQVLRRGVLSRVPTMRDAGIVGTLLALLVLGRLDTAVLVALLGAYGLWRWRSVLLTAAVVVPALATLGVYAAVNHALFGAALPVSGLAKQLGPFGDNLPAVGQFLLYGSLGPLPLFFGATVLVVGGWALVLVGRSDVGLVIAGLLVAQVVQVGWYAVTTSGWELQSWYFSCGVMALVLSVGVVVSRASAAWVAPAVGVVVVGLLVVSGAHAVSDVLVRDPSASPVTRDIDAGLWADRTLPPGSVLAMGDWAGTLGVTTRVPVVQLEGLMGSPAYLAALRDGTVPQYLAGLGVTHYARLFHPGEPVSCRVSEPWFGVSPKVPLDLCGRPIVYRGDVQGVVELVVWDVRGAF